MRTTNIKSSLRYAKRAFDRLRPVFLALAMGLIAYYIVSHAAEVAELFSTRPNWLDLAASVVCANAATVVFALKIYHVYRLFDAPIAFRSIFAIYARSMLLNNLPGGIWNHVNLGVELHNHSRQHSATHTTTLLVLMMGVDIASIFLLIPLASTRWFHWAIGGLFYLALFITLWQVVKQTHRQFRFPGSLRRGYLVSTLLLLGVYWLLWGAAFTFMLQAFHQPINGFMDNVIVYNLAWLIGFLFLPAPGGIGVRELALEQLYTWTGAVITLGAVFSVLFRVLVLLRDVLMALVALVIAWSIPEKASVNLPEAANRSPREIIG